MVFSPFLKSLYHEANNTAMYLTSPLLLFALAICSLLALATPALRLAPVPELSKNPPLVNSTGFEAAEVIEYLVPGTM